MSKKQDYKISNKKMAEQPNPNQFTFTVKSPVIRSTSPSFGGQKITKKEVDEAQNRVGKHGKSHHLYLKVMQQHKPVKEMRKITPQELAEHSKPENAWMSLNGVVYDVSVYLHYHPGGDILLKGCGKQCYNLFHQYHPWVNAKALLQNYAIGYLQY